MDDLLIKSTWCTKRFVKNGFEEAAAFGLGGGELRFQPVAQSHQFFDFGNDALLFGKRRDWDYNRPDFPHAQAIKPA